MLSFGLIKKGEYFDSLMLMVLAKKVSSLPGIKDSAVVMGTKENLAILEHAELRFPEFENVRESDLLVAIKADDEVAITRAVTEIENELKSVKITLSGAQKSSPKSIDSALKILPGANLAMISVAGRFAGAEARKALELGLHVMLFSDNVPLDVEIELKLLAREKGLFVMGPDCGTAIINGVPLAFANKVSRGDIGIVAASGTGLQEISSIISREGQGISQAIGTGGRDIKKEVGGLMFIETMRALNADPLTKVIVLLAKPPYEDVLKKIALEANKIKKPMVAIFLGADKKTGQSFGAMSATTLEEAALLAIDLAKGQDGSKVATRISEIDIELSKRAKKIANQVARGRRYLRGLFSGGTFCTEAQLILTDFLQDIYSNVPAGKGKKLQNSLASVKNTLIDLGEDEFTVGRPHPMIDYSLRVKRIKEEAKAPETAVILLDVVLGYGSNMDPAGELAAVLKEATQNLAVVCSITGTDHDPQERKIVEETLTKSGAIVLPTNRQASFLAGRIIKELK